MNYILNDGGHQLAVYYDVPEMKSPFGIGNFSTLKRVPCASLLVRLVPNNSQNPERKYIEAPKYNDKLYDSSTSVPYPHESHLFSFIGVERIPLKLLPSIKPFMDTNAKTEEDILDWMAFHLTKPANGLVVNNPLEYTIKYDQRSGFKIHCDSASRLETSGFTFCNVKILNATRKGVKTVESYLYTKFNFKLSQVSCPVWNDGAQWFRMFDYSPYTVALFQLVTVKQNGANHETVNCGWSVCSIFEFDGYCKYGNYRLPVFIDSPSETFLEDLKTEPVLDLIEGGIKSKSLKYTRKYASLQVRVFDARREGEMNVENVEKDIVDDQYIGKALIGKFTRVIKSSKLTVPDGGDEKEYLRQIIPFVKTVEY